MDSLYNSIGLIGVALGLLAYFLLQHGTIKQTSVAYQLLNLAGSLALIISLHRFWNLASFLLNLSWAAISIYGLLKMRRSA
jgi:hypothetical protein